MEEEEQAKAVGQSFESKEFDNDDGTQGSEASHRKAEYDAVSVLEVGIEAQVTQHSSETAHGESNVGYQQRGHLRHG